MWACASRQFRCGEYTSIPIWNDKASSVDCIKHVLACKGLFPSQRHIVFALQTESVLAFSRSVLQESLRSVR